MLEYSAEVAGLDRFQDVGCVDCEPSGIAGAWDGVLSLVQDLGRGGIQLARERQAFKHGGSTAGLATMWNPAQTAQLKTLNVSGGGISPLLIGGALLAAFLVMRKR